MSRGSPSPVGPPPLLQRLYGQDNVLSLQDLLIKLSDFSSHAQSLKDTLLLHRSIEALLQSSQGKNNVLCYGYRKKRPSNTGRQLHGTASTESYHANSIADSLLSPAWQLLLSRIGDTLMIYLLVNVSMFSCLGNDCCLQLTGPSLVHVARQWKRRVPVAAAVAEKPLQRAEDTAHIRENQPNRQEPVEQQQQEQNDPTNRLLMDLNSGGAHAAPNIPATQDPALLSSMHTSLNGPQTQQSDPVDVLIDADMVERKKRVRPSSWQRRKASEAAARMAVDCDNVEITISTGIPPTQPLSDPVLGSGSAVAAPLQRPQQAVPLGAVDPGHGGVGGSNANGTYSIYSQWPRYMPKPSEMVINRNPVFYCGTFPPKPGLPAKHVLAALKGREDAGKVLYAAIFDPKNNHIGRAGNFYAAKHMGPLPDAPPRVPTKHAQVIPLLDSLVQKTAKCPFGLLLNLYCPLPRHMRKEPVGKAVAAAAAVAASGPPPPLVPDIEKDLDTLMNELHELEHKNKRPRAEAGTVPPPPAQQAQQQQVPFRPAPPSQQQRLHPQHVDISTFQPMLHPSRRRTKLTGLEQLVLEAGSQLDPVAAVGGAVQYTAAPGFGSQIPPTQPLSGILEEAVEGREFVPSQQGPAAALAAVGGGGSGGENAATTAAAASVESLSTCFVPHSQVTGFVWAAIRRIVPAALLGGKSNRRALLKCIRKFVSLRRYEQMNVQQILQRQKTSQHAWLQPPGQQNHSKTAPPSQLAAQQRMLMLWLGWLFSAVVVPLLRSHFFCTESEAYRQQVFYYRKPVWFKLASAAVDSLKGTQFAPVPTLKAQRILQGRKLGVAGLRLLPKRIGMRFIVNLSKKSKIFFKAPRPAQNLGPGRKHPRQMPTVLNFPSVNSMLTGIQQILKLEASRQPDAFGSSVFGYNDAYCRLQPFIRTWKALAAAKASAGTAGGGPVPATTDAASNGRATPEASGPTPSSNSNTKPAAFVVSADVSRAFDHVDVNILLQLVEQLLQSEHYLVLKYTEIVPCLGDVKVLPRRVAVPLESLGADAVEDFPSRAAQWARTRKGKIFVDGVVYERISRTDALNLMQQHLTANLVKLKKVWHYQCCGIAQGSTLSTLLCCLYLAHVERTCFMPIIQSFGPSSAGPGLSTGTSRQAQQRLSIGGAAAAGGSVATYSSRGKLTALASAAAGMAPSPAATTITTTGARAVPAPSARSGPGLVAPHPIPSAGGRPASVISTGNNRFRVPGHSVLLRLVDDWLLVTHHQAVAEQVTRAMLRGFPAFNMAVNPTKTKLSFRMVNSGGDGLPAVVEPSLHINGDGSRFVKWCGLLLDVDNLEIQGDYTRYAGEHISTSLTLPLRGGMGSALASKLCHYLRPKVCPLLLDPSINSPTTIRVNVYQAFAIGAMKFHCYVRSMAVAPSPGSKLLIEAIETGISFMVKLTRPRRVGGAFRPGVTLYCDPGLSRADVRYLGLHAFRKVLGRKQTAYKELLGQIEEALAAPVCVRCAKNLAAAVDVKKSTILDAIVY